MGFVGGAVVGIFEGLLSGESEVGLSDSKHELKLCLVTTTTVIDNKHSLLE